jgi:hypothetical protein
MYDDRQRLARGATPEVRAQSDIRRAGTIAPVRGVLAIAFLALLLGVPGARAGAPDIPRVTIVGDSVADAMRGDDPTAILRQGVDLDLEVEACRRVDGVSCPNSDGVPPTVVQLVKTMGSKLGPDVVVAVGYNDFEDRYAQNIENALAAMQAAGVKHVWWLTLRAAHHPYINMNDDIVNAAKDHPEMHVIDWNVYSRSHADWFQDDGLHLLGPGAEAMAGLIHKTLLDAGVALKPVQVVTTRLPPARDGVAYAAKLSARKGATPYRWSLLARAPKGLHL